MKVSMSVIRRLFPLSLLAAAACSTDFTAPNRGFLAGTDADRQIITTVLSLNSTLLQAQAGAPNTRQLLALGSSTQITPVGFSLNSGTLAAIPTGNAASVLVADLEFGTTRSFTWSGGNATGSAWFNASTIIATNPSRNLVGRMTLAQTGNAIIDTLLVAAFPTDVVVTNGRIFVVSSNLNSNFAPAGPGVITEISPTTFAVVRTFNVGRNPGYAAAFNNKLFVTNAGDFSANNGTLSVIDLATNAVAAPVTGFGDFPGQITIDPQGIAYVSGFAFGTVIYNTVTGTFVRGAANPLCAPVGNVCRGATGAQLAGNGRIYQTFFGSTAANQPGRIFVYNGTTLALTDSITVPVGTSSVDVRTFVP